MLVKSASEKHSVQPTLQELIHFMRNFEFHQEWFDHVEEELLPVGLPNVAFLSVHDHMSLSKDHRCAVDGKDSHLVKGVDDYSALIVVLDFSKLLLVRDANEEADSGCQNELDWAGFMD